MLTGSIALLSILISVTDIRTHKIPNRLNILLGVTLLLDRHSLGVAVVLISITTALALTILLRFGMGDFKLALALLISQSSLILTSQYLVFVIAMATLAVIVALIGRVEITGSIAFAPVILLPFTAIYLAI